MRLYSVSATISPHSIYAITRTAQNGSFKSSIHISDPPTALQGSGTEVGGGTHTAGEQGSTSRKRRRKVCPASPSIPRREDTSPLLWSDDTDYYPRITHYLDTQRHSTSFASSSTLHSADQLASSSASLTTLSYHRPYSLYDPRRPRLPSPVIEPSVVTPIARLPSPGPIVRSRSNGGKKKGKRGGKGKEKEKEVLPLQFIEVAPPGYSTQTSQPNKSRTPKKAREHQHQPYAPSPLKIDAAQLSTTEPTQFVAVSVPGSSNTSRKRKQDFAEETAVNAVSETEADGKTLFIDQSFEKPKARRRARKPKATQANTIATERLTSRRSERGLRLADSPTPPSEDGVGTAVIAGVLQESHGASLSEAEQPLLPLVTSTSDTKDVETPLAPGEPSHPVQPQPHSNSTILRPGLNPMSPSSNHKQLHVNEFSYNSSLVPINARRSVSPQAPNHPLTAFDIPIGANA